MFGETVKVGPADQIIQQLYLGLLGRAADSGAVDYWVGELGKGMTVADLLDTLINCDEYKERTRNAMFVPPGHFYSPIVDTREAAEYLDKTEAAGIPSRLPDIGIDPDQVVRMWHAMITHMHRFPYPDHKGDKLRYYTENNSYGFGDSVVLYAILNLYKPKKIIEVGSGFSSACFLDTLENMPDHKFEITFIEPYPQLLKDLIGTPRSDVTIRESRIQDVPLDVFAALDAGDLLFIDSTHIVRTGSDVCYEMFDILPVLNPGVIVHFHDMFWPFEYPRQWIVDQNRSWNELYAMRAFLAHNKDWEVLMFNEYVAKVHTKLAQQTLPRFLSNPGGGLWLKRKA